MNSNERSPNSLPKEFFCAQRAFVMNIRWFLFFCGTVLASVFIVLAFRRCMTHVDSAGRPHFLCSRRLFFSSGPLLLFLSYFLLCLGRTAADCPAVENHGGGL